MQTAWCKRTAFLLLAWISPGQRAMCLRGTWLLLPLRTLAGTPWRSLVQHQTMQPAVAFACPSNPVRFTPHLALCRLAPCLLPCMPAHGSQPSLPDLALSAVRMPHALSTQNLDALKAADVIICITGMDGGLATVVAGMVEVPVIALPTSTGEHDPGGGSRGAGSPASTSHSLMQMLA